MAKDINTEGVDYGVLNDLIGYQLRRAQITFFASFANRCAQLDITPGLFGVIEIVQKNPGLTQTAIANALGNDRSAMVYAVDKLEKMNIIERKQAVNDRRSYALSMTNQGKIFYDAILKEVLTHEEEFYSVLEEGEKDAMLDMLKRFVSLSK